MDLPRGFGDRLLHGVASAFLTLFFVPFLIVTHFWAPETILWRVVKYVTQDILFLFASAFFLALVWCLFTPRWVEKLLRARTPRLVALSVILVVGLTIALVVSEAARAF